MNLFLRTKPDDIVTSNDTLQHIIQQELSHGNITLSGRRSVWLHLRQLGIMASEYTIISFYLLKYLICVDLISL